MPGDIIYIIGVLAVIWTIRDFSRLANQLRVAKERLKKTNESQES